MSSTKGHNTASDWLLGQLVLQWYSCIVQASCANSNFLFVVCKCHNVMSQKPINTHTLVTSNQMCPSGVVAPLNAGKQQLTSGCLFGSNQSYLLPFNLRLSHICSGLLHLSFISSSSLHHLAVRTRHVGMETVMAARQQLHAGSFDVSSKQTAAAGTNGRGEPQCCSS